MGSHDIDVDNDRRVDWVLRRLRESLQSGHGGIELSTHFDDGMVFISDFSSKFPGRTKDTDLKKVRDRLYRLLKNMEKRGWCRSTRNSNYTGNGVKWVPEWTITSRGIKHIKD
jgi:hypothetical protein